MPPLEDSLVFWSLSAIQACGLASAWMARCSGGSRHRCQWERLFFACLMLVGLSTMGATLLPRSSNWLFGGATLGVMLLMAVWDVRPATTTAMGGSRN